MEPCGCCSSKMSARRRFIAKGLREQSHAVDLARDVDQIPGVGAGRLRTGFFIVKWIVDAHQDQIRVESRAVEGTACCALLPTQTSTVTRRSFAEPKL
jgi:signal transduction histidine kinase